MMRVNHGYNRSGALTYLPPTTSPSPGLRPLRTLDGIERRDGSHPGARFRGLIMIVKAQRRLLTRFLAAEGQVARSGRDDVARCQGMVNAFHVLSWAITALDAEGKQLFTGWLSWATRSRIPEFMALATTIERHLPIIHSTPEYGVSNARSETTNTHLRLLTRRAYRYHSAEALIAMATLTRGGL